MSDTSQPYDCSALERDLHLVIGGDLDPSDLARAQEHLSSCAACEPLVERASEMRQLYFEAAGRATAEPLDLWGPIRNALRNEGALAGTEPPASDSGSSKAQEAGRDGGTPPSSAARKPTTMDFATLAEMVPAREFLETSDSSPSIPAASRRAWRGPEHRAVLGVLAGAVAATLLILLRPDPVTSVVSVSESSGQLASSEDAGVSTPASGRVVVDERSAGAQTNDPASRGLHAISPYSQFERLALQDALYNLQPGFTPKVGAPEGAERLASFQSTRVELR